MKQEITKEYIQWVDDLDKISRKFVDDMKERAMKIGEIEVKKKEQKPISAEDIVINYITWRQNKESEETGEDVPRFNIFGQKYMLNLIEIAEKNNDLKYKELVEQSGKFSYMFKNSGNEALNHHARMFENILNKIK